MVQRHIWLLDVLAHVYSCGCLRSVSHKCARSARRTACYSSSPGTLLPRTRNLQAVLARALLDSVTTGAIGYGKPSIEAGSRCAVPPIGPLFQPESALYGTDESTAEQFSAAASGCEREARLCCGQQRQRQHDCKFTLAAVYSIAGQAGEAHTCVHLNNNVEGCSVSLINQGVQTFRTASSVHYSVMWRASRATHLRSPGKQACLPC